MPAYRSRTTTHGRNMAGARGLWRATGMKDEDFGKPIIAVVNSFTQFVPGHVHLKDLGQLVAREIEAAGGVAKEFNTIAIDDGIAMGHGGMLYSLPSRELIADSVEYMVNAHCADAIVCISNCDKITPGMLMAALRLNVPAVFVSGGPPLAEILKRIGPKTRLLRNARSSRVALLIPERTRLMDDGTPVASFTLLRPGGRSWITADELAESHWDDCEAEAFEQAWQVEADDLATKPYTERFYLATGRLLPIWNLLGDEAQVRRLVTQDGRSLLGRIVPAEAVNMLLDKLGIGDRIALSPDQLVEAALAGKVVPIDALSGTSLKRSRVNGEQRLEIIGFDPRALASWKARGCFTEIIAYQTRLFMPVNSAREIVAKLAA